MPRSPPPVSPLAGVPELVTIIREAMEALPRAAHSAFLAEVDYALGRSPELLGAGSVSRVCREVQLRFIAGRDARSAAIDGRS